MEEDHNSAHKSNEAFDPDLTHWRYLVVYPELAHRELFYDRTECSKIKLKFFSVSSIICVDQ